MSIWENFDSMADATKVQEEENKRNPFPEGETKLVLNEILVKEDPDGLPTIKTIFGSIEYSRRLFNTKFILSLMYPQYNDKNSAEANLFVNGLRGENVEFTKLSEMLDRAEKTEIGKTYNCRVFYKDNDVAKKYPQIEILGIDGEVDVFKVEDDDVPF